MAGDWWDFGDFNLGGGGTDFTNWWGPGQFNLNVDIPAFNFPAFDFSQSNLGFDPGAFNFNLPDPLALPPLNFSGIEGFQPAFAQQPGQDFGLGLAPPAPGMAAAPPTSLADLGFKGTAAPQTALPAAGLPQGSDALTNLMGSQAGLGYDPGWAAQDTQNPFAGLAPSPISTGGYAAPFSSSLNLGDYATPGGAPDAAGTPSLQDQLAQRQLARLDRLDQPPSTWDTIAKLAAAFGPTALGAAGLGLQAANRPQRNPLEDQLIQARIASMGQQDTLARDRLAFERDQAEANRAAQEEMQNALLESRRPGGQANITALLQGNPQLAALYQALTSQGTNLANNPNSPEFQAQVEQLAGVDIAELQRQAQQQIAQAQELAARTGVNPANIIAEVNQRLLQESQKARANARTTLISLLSAGMQPGINTFNTVGGLFGNLFQTPAAG